MKDRAKKRIDSRKRHIGKRQDKPASIKKKPVSVCKQKVVSNGKKRVISSKKPTAVMKSKVKRDKNGHILPGSGSNGGGRPKGSLSGIRVSEIRQSIARVEAERRKPKSKRKFKTWLDYQVDKSYDDTSLANSFLSRLYPILKAIEQVTFDGDLWMDDVELSDCRAEYCKRFGV